MLKNIRRFLGAASLLCFTFNIAFSQTKAAPSALASLLGSSYSAEMVQSLSLAVPAPAPLLVKGPANAPRPGKDLLPAIKNDVVRLSTILRLISDIYNDRQLPYSQDGVVFKNKEGILPQQPLGYYHEYTLMTGDAPHTVVIGGVTYKVSPDQGTRGSERIVIGGGTRVYYSPDHYRTFIEFTMVY